MGVIDAVGPMAEVDRRLLDLLDTITLDEWDRETIVPGWRVRHIAAHLLDTATRKLSLVRDGFFTQAPDGSLVDFINRLNAEGVAVYGRLSPSVMREQMAVAVRASADFHASLDPMAPAAFAVSWAGESESLNWFDTARELTERWHHQEQIRLALDRPGIMTPELYRPVIDTFMRVLPYRYRGIAAPESTEVAYSVTGECGGHWRLVRESNRWSLTTGSTGSSPAAAIRLPQEYAWRIFTKAPVPSSAIEMEGERSLALPALTAIAIVG